MQEKKGESFRRRINQAEPAAGADAGRRLAPCRDTCRRRGTPLIVRPEGLARYNHATNDRETKLYQEVPI